MPDQTNIEMLLSKLPNESLARQLVAPFETQTEDEATKSAYEVLLALKAKHVKEGIHDPADSA